MCTKPMSCSTKSQGTFSFILDEVKVVAPIRYGFEDLSFLRAPKQKHHHVGAECFHCAEVLFQASVIGKKPVDYDTFFQCSIEGDVATRKELYTSVVSSGGRTMCMGFLGAHDEGIDCVGSIDDEIKVATRGIWFPST